MTVALIVGAVLVLWFVVVRAWTRNDLRILTTDHKGYCSLPAAHQGPCVPCGQQPSDTHVNPDDFGSPGGPDV